jgi:hypothetical protein
VSMSAVVNTQQQAIVVIEKTAIISAGFTDTGAQQFEETVTDYANKLYDRAMSNGKVDQAANMRIEVTHQHVKNGAYHLASSFGKPKRASWVIYVQVLEYLFTALAGYGINLLTQNDIPSNNKGTICLIIGAGLAIICFVIRLTQNKSE